MGRGNVFRFVCALAIAGSLSGCTATGSENALNALGSVAGQLVASRVGGPAGEFAKKLGSNAGTIASAFDNSEQGETRRVADYEASLDKSSVRSKNRKLESYLLSIVVKLAANSGFKSYPWRVRLIRNKVPNAATPGGGLIVIHDSIVYGMENEAQVASILGHEMGHIYKKHPKRGQQVKVAASIAATVLDVFKPGLLSGTKGSVAALGASAGLNSFSRSQESEADTFGVVLIAKAGYDPREAVEAHRLLGSFSPQQGELDNFFFSNHPTSEARVRSMENLLRKKYAGRDFSKSVRNTSTFVALTRKYRH